MTKANILIVEDNPITAADLKSALKKLGFNITDSVSSYNEALGSISKNEPDIIMMDIELNKGKNGIELAYEIKKNKNIPILYLTSYSDDDTMEKAFATDPVGYLVKPFKREELKTTIMLALYKINKLEHENINQDHTYIGYGYYFDLKETKLYYKSKYIKLGIKEKQLLTILIKAQGLVISNEKLEHKLWADNAPSNSSLRTLVYRLKSKLGCNIIETSYSNGYKLPFLS
jgi:DNA-binding response OmpR family regulator